MKISKVGHVKSAVGKGRSNEKKEYFGGILYADPSRKGLEDLRKRFDTLNQRAQNLYRIFNQVQPGKRPGENASEEKKNNYERRERYAKILNGYTGLEKYLEEILFDKQEREGRNSKRFFVRIIRTTDTDTVLGTVRDKAPQIQRNRDKPENADDVDNLVSLYLRKSLKIAAPGISEMVKLLYGFKKGTEADKGAIAFFLTALEEDFTKKEFSERIASSIQNQNLPIQPARRAEKSESGAGDHVLGLVVPSASNSRGAKRTEHKVTEKRGLAEFLRQYASLDQKKRDDLLRKLRRIVDLYFYGEDKVDRSPAFNVWEAHEKRKKESGKFAELPETLKNLNEKAPADAVALKRGMDELYAEIRERNIACYRRAREAAEKNEEKLYFTDGSINLFWIHHIENSVERLLRKLSSGRFYRLGLSYLSEKVWKDAINLLSVKYIALGKAVYHFGLEGLTAEAGDIELGRIPDTIGDGISSFDYEQIKATETLQREAAVHIAFAANNLARATVCIPTEGKEKGKEDKQNKDDFLLWKKKDIEENRKKEFLAVTLRDPKRRDQDEEQDAVLHAVLQFFGGISSWKEYREEDGASGLDLFSMAYQEQGKNQDKYGYGINFLYDLKENIYALRNESFHFHTEKVNKSGWNTELIRRMFEREAGRVSALQKEKFYSNNVSMFYREDALEPILDKLYEKYAERASQVPSFNKVFVRRNFGKALEEEFRWTPEGMSGEERDKWQSAVYYVMKEIYYNAFLKDAQSRELFQACIEAQKKEYQDKRNNKSPEERAFGNFEARISELLRDRYSLSEICQSIMTEYNAQNAQNAGKRSVRSAKSQERNPEIFRHYRTLLFQFIRRSFAEYVKKSPVFAVLGKPEKKEWGRAYEKGAMKDFLPDWRSDLYRELIEEMRREPQLQRWYITGRLLNGKSLNLLAGSIRSFIQYSEDIWRRAGETGQTLHLDKNELIKSLKKAIPVLEFCIQLSSACSHEIEDYFPDPESYASYLAGYIAFDQGAGASELARLRHFCEGHKRPVQIYMDEENPILQRNIVMAKLFGSEQVMREVRAPISFDEIDQYFEAEDRINSYKKNGRVNGVEEQKALLSFQRIKNRIEFRDIVDYSELLNELLGQLINWSFLRERDLLYFQLGFHYSCIQSRNEKPEEYLVLRRDNGREIRNAILYQVTAMYVAGLRMISASSDKEKKKGAAMPALCEKEGSESWSTGAKIGAFIKYGSHALRGTGGEKKAAGKALYLAGLELFENVHEHDQITELRNKIDHFKYYTGNTAVMVSDKRLSSGSILDLYSEVFDRFFSYDMKYRKNVPNILSNILQRHFVKFYPVFETGEKREDASKDAPVLKKQAVIRAAQITSDRFTYSIEKETEKGKETRKLEIDARDADYLRTVTKLLYHPDDVRISLNPEPFSPKHPEEGSERSVVIRTMGTKETEEKAGGRKKEETERDRKGSGRERENSRKRGDQRKEKQDAGEKNYSTGGWSNTPFANLRGLKLSNHDGKNNRYSYL